MPTRPNILLFITDDHAPWSIGCYGNARAITPTLDRLAAEGARFTNAFTPCPVCSPARACLLTGRTPSQVGIHDWLQEAFPEIANRPWLADEMTLPELLHEAGYFTALSGKWHLGSSHKTPAGFDRCFGLPGHQGGHFGDYTFHLDGTPLPLTGNKSGHITDHAIEFLAAAPKDRPFFVNVGFQATHSPYPLSSHDPKSAELFKDAQFDLASLPPPHPWRKNEGLGANVSPEEVLSCYRGYYTAVAEIDRNIGRIVKHMELTGELRNTVIVYVSDHGCALGHHGFWGKGNSTRPLNMYETSLRVPLIIRGEDFAGGKVIDSLIDHYDTFQTLLEIAGIAPPAGRQYPGKSYLRNLRGGTSSPRPQLFGEYGDLRMIRTEEWKFVKRYPTGPHDLFDLQADPGELKNLAGLPATAMVQADLDGVLETWYSRHENPQKSGLRVKQLPVHNSYEAWRDGRREAIGLQVY